MIRVVSKYFLNKIIFKDAVRVKEPSNINVLWNPLNSKKGKFRVCCNAIYANKRYSTSSNNSNQVTNKNTTEIQIPLPFGQISGKCWGNENGFPILALHGWLDNCGTFDKLLPLLSKDFFIVAIDAPGHGKSSHKPPGSYYTDIGMLIDFKRVVEFFGWKKFHIMGHSLGGALAMMFTSFFPLLIEKLIVLDAAKPSSRAISSFPHEIMNAIENHFKIESKMIRSPPLYTVETAALRLKEGMYNEVTLEGAKILNQRGTRPSDCGKGVIFSRDVRCRTVEQFSRRSHEYIEQCMSEIHCEMLLIMAKSTHPNYATATPEVLGRFFDIYKKNCKKFVLERVEGNHFVHLNNPERIAPIINKYLEI